MTTDIKMGGGIERWMVNTLNGLSGNDVAKVVGTKYYDRQRFDHVEFNGKKVQFIHIDLVENKFVFFRKNKVLSFLLDNFLIPLVILIMKKRYIDAMGPIDGPVYLTKNQYCKLFKNNIVIGSNHAEFRSDSLIDVLKAKLYSNNLIYKNISAFHCFPGRNRINNLLATRAKIVELPNGTPDMGLPNKGDVIKFLYVGRLERIKGIELLIESWKMKERENCTLEIVGGGSLDVDKLVHSIPSIHFNGIVSDQKLRELFLESHYFIYPTRWDSFPMTVIEAMSASCQVITTGILRESFKKAVENDLINIVKPDVDSLSAAIDTAIENSSRLKEKQPKIHEFFMGNYELDVINERLYSFIRSLQ